MTLLRSLNAYATSKSSEISEIESICTDLEHHSTIESVDGIFSSYSELCDRSDDMYIAVSTIESAPMDMQHLHAGNVSTAVNAIFEEDSYATTEVTVQGAKDFLAKMVDGTVIALDAVSSAVSTGLSVFNKKSVRQMSSLESIMESHGTAKSGGYIAEDEELKLSSVARGFCNEDGDFSFKEMIKVMDAHIAITGASAKSMKGFSEVIDRMESEAKSGADEWSKSGQKTAVEALNLFLTDIKKSGGGSLESYAKKTTKDRRTLPGGSVHVYGPLFGGKKIEILIADAGGKGSSFGKPRIVGLPKSAKKAAGKMVPVLTLPQIKMLHTKAENLASAISEVTKNEKSVKGFYSKAKKLISLVEKEAKFKGTKDTHHVAATKHYISSVRTLVRDLTNLHSIMHGRSLKGSSSAVDASIAYLSKSVSNYKLALVEYRD